jgi:hypothetical protein
LVPLVYPTGQVRVLEWSFDSSTRAALVLLSTGTLLVALNQIFLVSSTWARYVLGMLAIEMTITVAKWDWELLKPKLSGTVSEQDRERAIQILKALEVESLKTVQAETTTWSSELAKATEQLATLIRDQRTAAETSHEELLKSQEEAKKAADQARREAEKAAEAAKKASEPSPPGGILVTIEGAAQRIAGQIKVRVGDQEEIHNAEVRRLAFPRVPTGPARITLETNDSAGKPISDQTLVEVQSGKVCSAKLEIPAA